MKKESQPLAILYGYVSSKNEMTFVGRKGLILINGRSSEIKAILMLCNGINTVNYIINSLRKKIGGLLIIEILEILKNKGVVVDSRELYMVFHLDSSNPPDFVRYQYDVTSLSFVDNDAKNIPDIGGVRKATRTKSIVLDVARRRRSVRRFTGKHITMKALFELLETAYSRGNSGHWTVGSGGGLYPLDIYLIITRPNRVIGNGIYRWNPVKKGLVTLSTQDPNLWIRKIFNANTILDGASCILCVVGDIGKSSMKYANRGYRLTLIEAGHIIQNAILFCIENDLGTVEYCGFGDEAIANRLGLDFPKESVLTSLIVGIEDGSDPDTVLTDLSNKKIAISLHHKMSEGDGAIISDVSIWEPKISKYVMPRWAAVCKYKVRYSLIKPKVAFATGITSDEAMIKVLSEGFERYSLDLGSSALVAKIDDLENPYLDPRVVVPYLSKQYPYLTDIVPFDQDSKIEWVSGVRKRDNQKIWVPRQLVYFANRKSFRRGDIFYRANSSGVASHFDKEVAISLALYELIERDAFMVTWYSKRLTPFIPQEILDDELKYRISMWNSVGYQVSLLDMTIDGPPVVMVVIWSKDRSPSVSSGSACRLIFSDAIHKAFDEAEFMAMSWHYRRIIKIRNLASIQTPDDHGRLYVNPKNFTRIAWLINQKEIPSKCSNFTGSLDWIDPIIVDITPVSPLCGLKVVRVLSTKLIPINFGYGSEHLGHSRLKMLGLKWMYGYPSYPHFFA